MNSIELCEKLFNVDICELRVNRSGSSVFQFKSGMSGKFQMIFSHMEFDYVVSYFCLDGIVPDKLLMMEYLKNIKLSEEYFACEEVATFTEILNLILQHETLDKVIEKLSDRILKNINFDSVGFLFFNETIMSLKCAMFRSKFEGNDNDNASFRKIHIPMDFKSPLTDVLFYNKSIVINFDLLGVEKLAPYFSGAVAIGNIYSKKGPLGVIIAEVKNEKEFSVGTFNLYTSLASVAVDLIKTIKIHEFALEDIKYFKENIAKTNGLAQVGKFAATVAHEIKNPLVSIGGFTAKLGKYINDEKGQYYLKIVTSEIDRLDRIVSDILGFTRQSSLKLSREDLNKIVTDCLDLLKDKIKSNQITTKIVFLPDIPVVYVDAKKIKQVIINIVENAIQSVEIGGKIIIRTFAESNRVKIAFLDNGPGFDEAIRDKLFEPFFTTKDYGTGLGLSICRQIMLEHNGSINIQNTDEGTLILLELPLRGVR